MNSQRQKEVKTGLAAQGNKMVKAPSSMLKGLSAEKEELALTISNNVRLFHAPAHPLMTDEECMNTIEELFQRCADNGEIVTVEKMALALGVDLVTLRNWENNNMGGPNRSKIIKQAKLAIQSIDAELVLTGRIPAVPYIFRAKNFYGMRDQNDVVVSSNDPVGDKANAKELADKYDVIFDQDE